MQRVRHLAPLFMLFSFFTYLNVCVVGSHTEKSNATPTGVNQLSPKAYVVQYWTKQISNDLPKPSFLLEKASPLTTVESATFAKLATQNALSTHLPSFCSSAKLLCFPDFKNYQNLQNGRMMKYTRVTYVYNPKLDVRINYQNLDVEPGEFFREEMLKEGIVMPMPDIRDKMPKRSFLPRVISSILPFSTSRIGELKKIFHAGDNSTMVAILTETFALCEWVPARGETKRCVGSVEDMIDFATSVLGRNVVVRTPKNAEGSNKNVTIGTVKGINGGRVTKAASCHQSLFPYLIYYCHSIPNVRVYEVDILDSKSKTKINHGVAVCHLDTSAWSATHVAFIALGSSPGKIEVCHWIYENEMNWAIAD